MNDVIRASDGANEDAVKLTEKLAYIAANTGLSVEEVTRALTMLQNSAIFERSPSGKAVNDEAIREAVKAYEKPDGYRPWASGPIQAHLHIKRLFNQHAAYNVEVWRDPTRFLTKVQVRNQSGTILETLSLTDEEVERIGCCPICNPKGEKRGVRYYCSVCEKPIFIGQEVTASHNHVLCSEYEFERETQHCAIVGYSGKSEPIPMPPYMKNHREPAKPKTPEVTDGAMVPDRMIRFDEE